MPTWLLYVAVCVATYRLTRLIIEDNFPLVAWPRQRAIAWLYPSDEEKAAGARGHWGRVGESLAYMLECPWCVSPYTGALIIWGVDQVTSVPLPALLWACASAVTGWLNMNEPE